MVGGRLPIPEIHTDFPLAALGEELGLVGVIAILGLYLRGHRARAADRRLGGRRLPGAPGHRAGAGRRRPGVHHRGRQSQGPAADRRHAAVHQLRRLVAARQRHRRRPAARAVRPGRRAAAAAEPATALARPAAPAGRPDARDRGPSTTARTHDRPRRARPVARLRRPRRRRAATGRSSRRPSSSARRRSGRHRGRPDRAARHDPRPRRRRSSRATRRTRTASSTASTAARPISQVVGYASTPLRAGRPGARLRRRAVRARPATRWRTPCASSAPTRTTRKDLHAVAVAATCSGPRCAALGDARGAVVMLDPRNGEVLALASTPTYDASAIAEPGDRRRRRSRRSARTTTQPLLPRATLGPLRAGLGVQDRDRHRRPRLGRDHAGDDLRGAAGGRARTASLVEGFRIRDGHHLDDRLERRSTSSSATEVSCNIWYALTGLRDRRRRPRRLRRAAGVRGADPVRPADGGLAGDERRRAPRRAASSTTSSWRTPPTARPRRSSTPLQMALVAATIANDGELMRPRLVTAMTGERRDARRSARRRSRRVIDAGRRRRRSTRRWSRAVEGRSGRQFTTGAKVPGVTTAGKSGTAELGGTRRAALLVHRLRAGRGTRRSRSPSSSSRPAAAREVAAPIAGDLMTPWLESSE